MTVVFTKFAGNKPYETAAQDIVRRATECCVKASAALNKGGSGVDGPFARWFGAVVDPGPVMSFDAFKTSTSRTFSLRNGKLGDVDTALKAYHDPKKGKPATTKALYDAVRDFIDEKNVKYATTGGLAASKRESKSNAVSTLWAQVKWAQELVTNPLAASKYGDVTAKVNRMLHYISNLPVTIEYAGSTLNPNTNAEATHYNEAFTKSYQGREASAADAGVMIKLPDRFFTQLKRIQSDDQTQIETLIHELSHVAAGTKDMERADHTSNPQPCYGRVAALALAQNFPDQARDNAENYGFFIVEVGGETQVVSKLAPVGSGKKWATVETGSRVL